MKENHRKPNKYLTIFGVLFIIAGFIIAVIFNPNFFNNKNEVADTQQNGSSNTNDQTEQTKTETSYILIEKEDGSLRVEPRTEADKKRHPSSSLPLYEHDYCAQYFLLSNVKMTESGSKTIIKLIFENTSDQIYSSVYIYCDFIDKNGVVIDQTIDSLKDVKPNQSYAMELWEYYNSGEVRPAYFKITRINFYWSSGQGLGFPFD